MLEQTFGQNAKTRGNGQPTMIQLGWITTTRIRSMVRMAIRNTDFTCMSLVLFKRSNSESKQLLREDMLSTHQF
jgi:hypothetical protein